MRTNVVLPVWVPPPEVRPAAGLYIQRGVLQALNLLSIHVTFTAIVPGAYPGEVKMCLRLSWDSQIVP